MSRLSWRAERGFPFPPSPPPPMRRKDGRFACRIHPHAKVIVHRCQRVCTRCYEPYEIVCDGKTLVEWRVRRRAPERSVEMHRTRPKRKEWMDEAGGA